MAVMADFAKLPRRQKVMLFAVIALMLGLLYNQFVLKKLKADLEEAQGEHDSKVAENSRLEHDIPEFQKLKARMVNLNRIIDENAKALPTEAELPAFFDMLNRKVLESGVEVVRSSQGKEVPIESFVKVPIDYEIQGSYTQIKKFFASLLPHKKKAGEADGQDGEVAEKERIVSIENLSLSNPTVRNREIRLTAKFTASTYRQEEKGDAAPGPRPAPKPTTPPPPQQPKVNPSATGASTPAGAKAKTDDAMDKNQQRNNGASSVDSGSARMKGGL